MATEFTDRYLTPEERRAIVLAPSREAAQAIALPIYHKWQEGVDLAQYELVTTAVAREIDDLLNDRFPLLNAQGSPDLSACTDDLSELSNEVLGTLTLEDKKTLLNPPNTPYYKVTDIPNKDGKFGFDYVHGEGEIEAKVDEALYNRQTSHPQSLLIQAIYKNTFNFREAVITAVAERILEVIRFECTKNKIESLADEIANMIYRDIDGEPTEITFDEIVSLCEQDYPKFVPQIEWLIRSKTEEIYFIEEMRNKLYSEVYCDRTGGE